jgi:hypothetical protein
MRPPISGIYNGSIISPSLTCLEEAGIGRTCCKDTWVIHKWGSVSSAISGLDSAWTFGFPGYSCPPKLFCPPQISASSPVLGDAYDDQIVCRIRCFQISFTWDTEYFNAFQTRLFFSDSTIHVTTKPQSERSLNVILPPWVTSISLWWTEFSTPSHPAPQYMEVLKCSDLELDQHSSGRGQGLPNMLACWWVSVFRKETQDLACFHN